MAQSAAVSTAGVLLFTATIAASLAGLLGAVSVTGRLTPAGLAHRHSMATVTAVRFTV